MGKFNITLSNKDLEQLGKIKKYLTRNVKLDPLGHYRSLSDEELWLKIVMEFCGMGGTRMIENLIKSSSQYSKFKEEINLNKILSIKKSRRRGYIANTLKKCKATRFHSQQARKLNAILGNRKVIRNRRFVLLKGLSRKQPFNEIRDKLLERNPYFKLKSASDFMIEVGLSHDVIALDTRIVGVLNNYFGLNLDVNRVQSNKVTYESVEGVLRDACKKIGISLAYLDRMLFRFSGKNAIAFILEYLE